MDKGALRERNPCGDAGRMHNTQSAGDISKDRRAPVDPGNDRIVRIDDMTGANWTTVGTFGTGTAQFDFGGSSCGAGSVAIDSSGKIYVADCNNQRIVRMDGMSGSGWTTFGTSGTGADQFFSPASVSVP